MASDFTALSRESLQAIYKKWREISLAARFLNSRGVTVPRNWRRTNLRLNAPIWVTCRFEMLSSPRRVPGVMPPLLEQLPKLHQIVPQHGVSSA
jgi:hypothetical protein